MCRGGRHKPACMCGATEAPPPTAAGMMIRNGFLTAAPNRRAPSTDLHNAPRDFRRYVDASGFEHVQLNNGLHRRTGQGIMSTLAAQSSYLTAIVPMIPGQMRDNFGGFQPKGMDPQSYQALWNAGPGSQPTNPGGVGKIAADYYVNPYAGGG